MSCTVAHGLRPKYVHYRRQEVTTVDPSPIDVQTEAQTIIAESINPEAENIQTAETETEPPVEMTDAPGKGTEIEKQTVFENLQDEVTPEPQNEETETAAPKELQTDPMIEPTHLEPELESKPTEAPENEAVEQKEAESELKQQDPEREAQQNEQEQEQNDQEAKNEPLFVPKTRIDDKESVVTQQEPNESEPPKQAEPIDQKDADITTKDDTNNNQVNDDEIKSIVSKYFNSVPDIKSQYVLNEGLAKSITHYFKNKVVALPLFHINMKIDRNLVKIPWETGPPLDSKKKKAYPYRILPGLKKIRPRARK